MKTDTLFWGNDALEALKRLLDSYPAVYLLCDTNTQRKCLPLLQEHIKPVAKLSTCCIPAGEKHKNPNTLMRIWQFLFEQKAMRHSLLLCLGGGTLCDMGGFAAATWKRGIDFALLPTTLMAQADAAIGGKTAINFHHVKNQIGLFQQATAILFYPDFLQTLSTRHIRSGFAEMLKHGLVADSAYWHQLTALRNSADILKHTELIRQSALIKQHITSKDFKERDIRLHLNFGHTIGHAIEVTGNGKITHGEAIANGMLLASKLSAIKGMLSSDKLQEITLGISKFYRGNKFQNMLTEQWIPLLWHDKKRDDARLNFTLLEDIGKAKANVHVEINELLQVFAPLYTRPDKHE